MKWGEEYLRGKSMLNLLQKKLESEGLNGLEIVVITKLIECLSIDIRYSTEVLHY